MDSIELLVDDDTEAALRSEWALLEAAGLPNAGRTTSETNRPHVTLVAASVLDDRSDAAAAAVPLPLAFRTGGLIVFPGPRTSVLSRLVVASEPLLALQGIVAALPSASPPVPTSLAGAWTAHLTLARRLGSDELARAVDVLRGHPEVEGSFTALRRWDATARVTTLLAGGDAAGSRSLER